VARYVGQRLIQLLIVLVVVTFLVSIALRFLPGGSDVVVALKTGPGATPEQAAAIKHQLYLDRSIPDQYVHWVKDLVTGNWGTTFQTNQPIKEELGRALPISLRLMIYAQFLALFLAVPMGMWSAYKQGSGVDRATTTASFGLLAMPEYIVAPLLIFLFVFRIRLPIIGHFSYPASNISLLSHPMGHFKAFFLPAVTIAIPLYATYMRLLRADMIATLQSDFITTARAKGLSTKRILFGHALRPSLFSLVTAAAVSTGALIGGVVIVEETFQLNGMGRVTVEGIFKREYPTVQYGVIILALVYVFVNFFVDLAYAWIDPRVRHARALG
jgi:peptide/nickel transport system permease protein